MNRDLTDGGRIRVRSCALILKDGAVLLVQLNAPTRREPIWMPPGGEVIPGETLQEAVVRETREETGLLVRPVRLTLIHEFLSPPYHAVEYYWLCDRIDGVASPGVDPDRDGRSILTGLEWVPVPECSNRSVYPLCLRTGMDRYIERTGRIEIQQSDERRE